MSTTEIKFNKEQANYGIEQLKQCQKELYEADKLFYKGVMALASAKGMDLILKEDAGINLYMPEKIVIECRDEVATLIEEISTKIALVQDFNEEPKEGTETVQYRKTTIAEETVTNDMQALYAPPSSGQIGTGTVIGGVQALYAPPGVEPIEGVVEGPIQALYAPPGIEPIEGVVEGPIQALYAPPGIEPIEGVVDPGVQPLYGVITPTEPSIQPMYGVITPTEPSIQPMYGVITPTEPSIQPMYGVIDPVVGPIEGIGDTGPIQALYAPPGVEPSVGVPDTAVIPEYEPIPDTGIPGVIEKNYVSKHPRLIGGLAATIGLFGIPTMLSDDFDEEEEKRMNGKED